VLRKSKLPKNAVVERRKYRLDKSGEKRDITLKAIRKLRSQKSIIRKITGKKKKPKKKAKKKPIKKKKTTKKAKKERKRKTKN
jgi:hypothetical protein